MKIIEVMPIEGANIYCHKPVVRLKLDLGEYAEVSTREISCFPEKLVTCIPSLQEHYCSRGKPGGFVERLYEGTFIGHVVEHVALELQHLAGFNVIFGKTVRADEPGMYYVVTEFVSKEGGVQALRSAVEIVGLLLQHREVNVGSHVTRVREVATRYSLGPSTDAIAREAVKRGIPVMRLGEGSILQLGYGRYHQKVEATITGGTKCIGVDIACDKVLVKQLLSESGIPVPYGGIARTDKEALEIKDSISDSVVVKPFDGNQGKGVALNLETEAEICRAMEVALAISPKAIVEKFIKGKHYRLTVVGNKVVAASERIPAFVVGDGRRTVSELVATVNMDPLRGEDHEKPMTKIKIDSVALMVLAKKGLVIESVPAEGEVVYLRENANLSTGGIALDVTGQVHPDTVDIVLRAVRLVGLDVAGVDLVVRDINQPLSSDNGAVIEINACPGIRMHHYPARGKSRNVAGAIVDMLFPQGAKSRIPIVSVTGTNGKTTVTRMISHILQGTGYVVGSTTTDGIYVNGKKIVSGDTTGPRSARVVLRDPSVEIAVLETARGGIIRSGLGYDYSDVGVITNISNDHLGLDGVETLEDLAYVKSVVAEAVHNNGFTVLNADDINVSAICKRLRSGLIYFSAASDNIIVRRHLSVGGIAVFVKNGYVVISRGNKTQKVLPVKHIPSTHGGIVHHNLQNALAAAAGCVALGTELEFIREGLLSFRADEKCNPGRFNIFEINGFRAVVDYGHNEDGYLQTLQAVKKLKPKGIIGVVGLPGDRTNESITAVGQVAAKYCSRLIIKEDADRRGRLPGEVAGIIRDGALKAGMGIMHLDIELSEVEAVKKGIKMAKDGDIVVIFYEKLDPVIQVIRETGEGLLSRTADTGKEARDIVENIS